MKNSCIAIPAAGPRLHTEKARLEPTFSSIVNLEQQTQVHLNMMGLPH